jgi:hypothetical protein
MLTILTQLVQGSTVAVGSGGVMEPDTAEAAEYETAG